MSNENGTNALWPALLEVQKKIGNLARSEENPFFKSTYVPLDKLLDAVRPVLSEHGLVLTQTVLSDSAAGPFLSTQIVMAETGEVLDDSYPIRCQDPNNPQQFGAAVTYARRYGLKALLGIAEEDDDGNAASKAAPQRAQTAPQPAQGTTSAPRPASQTSPAPPRSQGKGGGRPAPVPKDDDIDAVMEMARQLDSDAEDRGEKFRIVKDGGKIGVYGKVAQNMGVKAGVYSPAQLASLGALAKLREFYAYLCKKNDLVGYLGDETPHQGAESHINDPPPLSDADNLDLSETF